MTCHLRTQIRRSPAIRRALVGLLVFLLWQGLPAAAQERYTDPQAGFSLVPGPGWVAGAHPDHPKACLALRKGEASLGVYTFSGRTLPDMVRHFDEGFARTGARKTYERTWTVNEIPTHMTVWEDARTAAVTTVMLDGNCGFILMNYAPARNGQDLAREILAMVESFRRTPPPATSDAPPTLPPSGIDEPRPSPTPSPEDTF